jgi:mono/diheme cytochrome c family protein
MILLFVILSAFFGSSQYSSKSEPKNSSQELLADPGLELLEKHCYVCHNPTTASHDEIIAPPLFGIKNHYRKTFPEKDRFLEAMIGFVAEPTEDKALMKGPMKRFGLMPKPAVNQEEIKLIVAYIEANEVQKPQWYDAHHGNN